MFCRYFVAHTARNITCVLVFTRTNVTRRTWKYWLFCALSVGTFIFLCTFIRFSFYFWITGLFFAKAVLRLFITSIVAKCIMFTWITKVFRTFGDFCITIIFTEVSPVAVYVIVTPQTSLGRGPAVLINIRLACHLADFHSRSMSCKKMILLNTSGANIAIVFWRKHASNPLNTLCTGRVAIFRLVVFIFARGRFCIRHYPSRDTPLRIINAP